jgi:tetratricopeptide (TPR) repeat protein
VLLYLLLEVPTGRPWLSAFSAALFAIHPLHVEPVAWISSRKDVLSTAFGLLALLAYARWKRGGRWWAHAGALCALACSLLSKQMLVTAPLLLLLLDRWPLDSMPRATPRARKRWILEKLPFLALAVVFAAAAFGAQRAGGSVADLEELPVGQRLANAAVVPVLYLWKTVWPTALSVLYRYPETIPFHHVAGALLVLGGITAWTVRQVERRPYLLVGWCWYLITLLPVLGIVQIGEQRMADRYTYVPLIGPFFAVTWLVASAAPARLRGSRVMLGAAGLLVLAALAVVARAQLGHWRDSAALFRRALEVDDRNASAHNNLGVELGRAGRLTEALPHFQEALRLRPDSPDALNNLGNTLQQLGRTAEALELHETALRLQPTSIDARMNLVLALQRDGRHDEALRQIDEALALDPNREDARRFAAQAHRERGRTVALEGRLPEALEHFRRTLELEPRSWESHYDMAVALALAGRSDPASEHYRQAIALQPDRPDLHDELGVVLLKLGRRDEAMAHFREALALSPDYRPARDNLERARRSEVPNP